MRGQKHLSGVRASAFTRSTTGAETWEAEMKGILLRVGCDQTVPGGSWNAPVNTETWDYAYVPIPADEANHNHIAPCPTYSCFENSVRRLGTELPGHLSGDRKAHLDPDFVSLTIGEPFKNGRLALRGIIMNELSEGDIIAFYAAFKPIQPGYKSNLAYCLFGIFRVKCKSRVRDLAPEKQARCAHGRRDGAENDLVIWGDSSLSGRFEKAIPFGSYRNGAYRVEKRLLDVWGGLRIKDGYVQRGMRPPHFEETDKFLDWLNEKRKGTRLLRDNG
jgi:hypothetical protein